MCCVVAVTVFKRILEAFFSPQQAVVGFILSSALFFIPDEAARLPSDLGNTASMDPSVLF